MPSYNQLLVLTVLAVSGPVFSAPVDIASRTDLNLVNGHTAIALASIDARDFVAESDANELDTGDFDDVEDEDDEDDLDTRDFEEDSEDDDAEEDDSEVDDQEDSFALERRVKTTKSATKPPRVKTTPAKTTVQKTAPKTTVAKPVTKVAPKTTVAKPVKPAQAITPPKVVKPAASSKAAKPAATTKGAKAATPPTATKASKAVGAAKATETAEALSCPIRKPAKKPGKLVRALDYISSLFERNDEEFIGWHGTNSDTAALWLAQGKLVKPVKKTGFFDFFSFGPASSGTSGADAELGDGVYITDDHDVAEAFANNNAKVNAGTTPAICAIFALNSGNWRNVIQKAFIPENLVGDSATASVKEAKEAARIAHIKSVKPGVSATSVVKFASFNRKPDGNGQLVLPASITNLFTAQCFANLAAIPANLKADTFPAFKYQGATLTSEWKITAANAAADGCA